MTCYPAYWLLRRQYETSGPILDLTMTEEQWLASHDPIRVLESARGWPSPRKQRLFAAACCRRLALIVPGAPYFEPCLIAAERSADKQIKRADLQAARAGVPRLEIAWRSQQHTYAEVLIYFVGLALAWASEPVQRRFGAQAALNAAAATAYATLPQSSTFVLPDDSPHAQRWKAAEAAEKALQLALLRDVCGDPYHPVTPRIGKLNRDIVQLARACYDERLPPHQELDPHRLAVIADALEESGCTDESLLEHCRAAGPHVRGCWAVDCLLGRT